ALHDTIWRGQDNTRQKGSHGAERTDNYPLPKGHAGHSSLWQRRLADRDERTALPTGRPLPYQYGGRAGAGDGYTAPPQKPQQADIYDNRWQTHLSEDREQVLQEQLWDR